MRKLLLSASLAGLLLTAGSLWVHAIPPQSTSRQQSEHPATKTVAGKVMSIGNGGHSFALEVNEGGAKQTMQFVLDKDAKVEGRVTVGTSVTVEYQAMQGGQNLALSISAQA
jgi:ribosomal protein S1